MIFKQIVWKDRHFILFNHSGCGLLFENKEFEEWPNRTPEAFAVVRSSRVYKDGEYAGDIRNPEERHQDMDKQDSGQKIQFVPRPKLTPEKMAFYDLYGFIPTDKQMIFYKKNNFNGRNVCKDRDGR